MVKMPDIFKVTCMMGVNNSCSRETNIRWDPQKYSKNLIFICIEYFVRNSPCFLTFFFNKVDEENLFKYYDVFCTTFSPLLQKASSSVDSRDLLLD